MTLNSVMALILRYFTEFGKPAFQHIIASARIELIEQKLASITHTAVKCASVTKCNDFGATFLIYRLSFALSFLCLFWCLTSGCDKERRPVAQFMREFTVFCSTCTISLKSSRSLSHLLMSFFFLF